MPVKLPSAPFWLLLLLISGGLGLSQLLPFSMRRGLVKAQTQGLPLELKRLGGDHWKPPRSLQLATWKWSHPPKTISLRNAREHPANNVLLQTSVALFFLCTD